MICLSTVQTVNSGKLSDYWQFNLSIVGYISLTDCSTWEYIIQLLVYCCSPVAISQHCNFLWEPFEYKTNFDSLDEERWFPTSTTIPSVLNQVSPSHLFIWFWGLMTSISTGGDLIGAQELGHILVFCFLPNNRFTTFTLKKMKF